MGGDPVAPFPLEPRKSFRKGRLRERKNTRAGKLNSPPPPLQETHSTRALPTPTGFKMHIALLTAQARLTTERGRGEEPDYVEMRWWEETKKVEGSGRGCF